MEFVNSVLDSIGAIARGRSARRSTTSRARSPRRSRSRSPSSPASSASAASPRRSRGHRDGPQADREGGRLRRPGRRQGLQEASSAAPSGGSRARYEKGKQWAHGEGRGRQGVGRGQGRGRDREVTGRRAEAQHGPRRRVRVRTRARTTRSRRRWSPRPARSRTSPTTRGPSARRSTRQLPVIRERHRLKELKLIEEEGETKVQATINPTRTVPVEIPPRRRRRSTASSSRCACRERSSTCSTRTSRRSSRR